MSNYTGKLKGFPREVIDKMCDRQEEQGNPRNPIVFDINIMTCKQKGGFEWDETIETGEFWYIVLVGKDFDVFFQKYPKKSKYPKEMYVSDLSELKAMQQKIKKVVFAEKCGKFIAWTAAETIEQSEKITSTNTWMFAVDIPKNPQIIELTIEDISNGKGVGVDPSLIRIKK